MKTIIPILIALLLSLVTGEAYLRSQRPQLTYSRLPDADTGCYQADPIAFAVPKPGTTCIIRTPEYTMKTPINPQGFLGTESVNLQKTDGRTRIAFIGDSFTFGQGVSYDQAYPALIGQLLNKQRIPAEILNASMVGSGPQWYYLRLKEMVKTYTPDIVVVGLYVGNDFGDLRYFQTPTIDASGLPLALTTRHEYVDTDGIRRPTSIPMRYRIPVLRNSHLFQMITTRMYGDVFASETPSINADPCLLHLRCPDSTRDIEETVRLLTGMQRISMDMKSRLLVVLIPWELQLPRRILALSRINFYATDKSRHIVSDTLMPRLYEAGISTLDLLSAFESYTGSEPVLYPQDRHWNAVGHTIAAEAIAPVLQSLITATASGQATETARSPVSSDR